MSTFEVVAALLVVAVAACAQGTLGFGLGLLAAPVLAIVDDDFVPGPLLMIAFVLTVMVAVRERGGLDWKGVKWAVYGRVPGSIAGALAVAALADRLLIIVFAALVLLAVLISAAGWHVTPTPPALFLAGTTSGLMGSITSIGGPPMAIVYQHRSGSELRATLALYFVFGSALSIVLLTMVGEMGVGDIGKAALLLPPTMVGYVASRYAARWLDRGFVRPAVLLFSGGASAVLLILELTS